MRALFSTSCAACASRCSHTVGVCCAVYFLLISFGFGAFRVVLFCDVLCLRGHGKAQDHSVMLVCMWQLGQLHGTAAHDCCPAAQGFQDGCELATRLQGYVMWSFSLSFCHANISRLLHGIRFQISPGKATESDGKKRLIIPACPPKPSVHVLLCTSCRKMDNSVRICWYLLEPVGITWHWIQDFELVYDYSRGFPSVRVCANSRLKLSETGRWTEGRRQKILPTP